MFTSLATMTMLLQRRRSRRSAVTRVSLCAVLREIVYILGFIRVPCARFPVVTHVAVTAMAKKMHRDEANRHGKPYPIVLKPVHTTLPLLDFF